MIKFEYIVNLELLDLKVIIFVLNKERIIYKNLLMPRARLELATHGSSVHYSTN